MEEIREKAEKIVNCIEVVYFIAMIICVFIVVLPECLCKSFGYKYIEDFVSVQLSKYLKKR